MTLSYVYACVFLAQKIHISENAKEALDEIGSYHIVFRDSMAVKVSICLNAKRIQIRENSPSPDKVKRLKNNAMKLKERKYI